MGGKAKRDQDAERDQRIVARARELFREIAERHRLTLEWDDCDQVELAAYLNKQPGLDWSLWLNVGNGDEIGI
jgi:hypothetical protein